MNKVELNVMELLEYLEEILENAPKVPITINTNNNTKSLIIFFINTPPNIKISIHINFSLRLIHSLYSV